MYCPSTLLKMSRSWCWHYSHATGNMSAGESHHQSWRDIMGDKGGKKDKEKGQKQKEKEKAKGKQEKQPKK